MGIRYGRVLAGGLLAGLIINLFEFIATTFVFHQAWADAIRALGRTMDYSLPQIVMFYVWGFLMGIAAVWVYAAIRPRFGMGPKTAVIAAFAVWIIGYALSSLPAVVMEIYPAPLMGAAVAIGLVEVVLGTVAGARIYSESAVPSPRPLARAGSAG